MRSSIACVIHVQAKHTAFCDNYCLHLCQKTNCVMVIKERRNISSQHWFLAPLLEMTFHVVVMFPRARIAYNVFNMDRKLGFIAKLPLIIGGFFLAGIKTIGAMMLPFGCNTSQPIPNILADTFFSKNGQVKFWPDNENVGSVLKKSDISLLQLVVNSNERC